MTEFPEPEEDDLRRHSEDPAEGADPAQSTDEDDVPREHPEDPSEG